MPEFEKLIREAEHIQCVSRIELHPNLEPDPNPETEKNISRTPSRMSHCEYCAEVDYWGNREAARKTGNLKIWECRRESVLESGSEWSGSAGHGVGMPALKAPQRCAIWRPGATRRGEIEPALVARVWPAAGLQIFSILNFPKSGHLRLGAKMAGIGTQRTPRLLR
jgi:hypothetical protein